MQFPSGPKQSPEEGLTVNSRGAHGEPNCASGYANTKTDSGPPAGQAPPAQLCQFLALSFSEDWLNWGVLTEEVKTWGPDPSLNVQVA